MEQGYAIINRNRGLRPVLEFQVYSLQEAEEAWKRILYGERLEPGNSYLLCRTSYPYPCGMVTSAEGEREHCYAISSILREGITT